MSAPVDDPSHPPAPVVRPPCIVLVGTQLAANIGMCARAMKNCGLTDLRLVAPRNGWPDSDAIAPAAGAADVIAQAQHFATLDEAIADCIRVYATSARRRDLQIPSLGAREAVAELSGHLQQAPADHTAILFGPEASGLGNDDLTRADRLINYDLNPDYSSLNLAQAVLLYGWEWWSHTREPAPDPAVETHDSAAPRAAFDHFFDRFTTSLDEASFFSNADQRPSTVQGLRAFFTRANPTERELRALQGVLTSLTRR